MSKHLILGNEIQDMSFGQIIPFWLIRIYYLILDAWLPKDDTNNSR